MIEISVIVPTKNRSTLLEITLNSILNQLFSFEKFEVIVVDNGSIDNTKNVCKLFSERFVNFKYIYEPRSGLHNGRHAGLNAASGEILAYIDDDIEAFPTWLEGIFEAFQNKSVVLVGGKNLPKWEVEPPHWLWEMWYIPDYLGRKIDSLSILDFGDEIKYIDPFFIWGCNFSVRKRILLEAGGFHPDSMPQDLIMYRGDGETHVSRYIQSKGYKALYHPKASIFHWVPISRMTTDYFCRRAFNQAISDSYTTIRQNGRIEVLEHKKQKISLLQKIRKVLLGEDIKKMLLESLKPELERKVAASYEKGYRFHQETANKSSELLAWILKESYF